MKKVFFTPGPAELYPTVERHIQTALEEQIGSISHRSQKFRDIYRFTVEQLRTLMNIPESHAIFFTGSATEVWERIIQNCVEHETFHLVNGSFSQKFHDFAVELGKYAHKAEKPLGEGFDYEDFSKRSDQKKTKNKILLRGASSELLDTNDNQPTISEYAELVCVTQNETSTGVQMRVEDIHQLKRSHPNQLFCVDMVSAAPYPDLRYDLIDSAFFSVQKAFGLPAGLGVWIANERCLEKAKRLQKYEIAVGTYHSLTTLWKNYEKWETPETPNVWSIYLLGKVAEDLNRIGIETVRRETDLKARKLYDFATKHPDYSVFVQNPNHRSATVVVLETKRPAEGVIEALKAKNIVLGSGYGKLKDNQIRIANFPAVSVAQVEALIEDLRKL
jgi:phosphoserine aminotransferase